MGNWTKAGRWMRDWRNRHLNWRNVGRWLGYWPFYQLCYGCLEVIEKRHRRCKKCGAEAIDPEGFPRIVAIVGPQNAGKSTFIHTYMDLLGTYAASFAPPLTITYLPTLTNPTGKGWNRATSSATLIPPRTTSGATVPTAKMPPVVRIRISHSVPVGKGCDNDVDLSFVDCPGAIWQMSEEDPGFAGIRSVYDLDRYNRYLRLCDCVLFMVPPGSPQSGTNEWTIDHPPTTVRVAELMDRLKKHGPPNFGVLVLSKADRDERLCDVLRANPWRAGAFDETVCASTIEAAIAALNERHGEQVKNDFTNVFGNANPARWSVLPVTTMIVPPAGSDSNTTTTGTDAAQSCVAGYSNWELSGLFNPLTYALAAVGFFSQCQHHLVAGPRAVGGRLSRRHSSIGSGQGKKGGSA